MVCSVCFAREFGRQLGESRPGGFGDATDGWMLDGPCRFQAPLFRDLSFRSIVDDESIINVPFGMALKEFFLAVVKKKVFGHTKRSFWSIQNGDLQKNSGIGNELRGDKFLPAPLILATSVQCIFCAKK